MEESGSKVLVYGQQNETDMQGINELSSVAYEMVRLIETGTAPVFGVDAAGLINGWNAKIAELTGLQTDDAIGKSLVDEVVHEDSRDLFENLLGRALQGEEDKNVELKLRNFRLHPTNSVVCIMVNACTSRDYTNDVVGVCFVGQDITSEKVVMDKFIRLQGDYQAIVQSLSPLIPPIFASDVNTCCSEWNAAMEKLTGCGRSEVIGKMLAGEIFGGLCQLKSQDSMTRFMILLYQGISGRDAEKLPFGFFYRKGKFVEVYLTANKRTNADGNIIGCFCFLQVIVPGMQPASEEHKQENKELFKKLKHLVYMRHEMKNPLNGIRFTHKLLETTAISEKQKQFLETSNACERQILAIIEDMDLGSIDEESTELSTEEFVLGNVLMLLLQLVISGFLLNVVHYAPYPDGWVELKISPGLKLIRDGNEFVLLQFRMTHPGQGLPSTLIQEMFEGGNSWTTQEGLGLNMSRKLLNKMNGRVQYVREHNKCYFLIDLEIRTRKGRLKASQAE
ncbi:hypothetical protein V6N13_132532 [Hibiscus sabdariffa]|uniref:Uncharacterized protein n=1 Tax=Hibiscus sabdariffa TaxID=183260 RepID=A0ABR2PVU5_9ROSI